MSYMDIYKKRVGIDTSSGQSLKDRLNAGRAKNFEKFLYSSPHYEKFTIDGKEKECVLEPSSQDETKTVMHLLCRVSDKYAPGQIVTIGDEKFMLFYLDQRKDYGYNRWTVLKMNRTIDWYNTDESHHSSDVYLFGKGDSPVKNTLKSKTTTTLYYANENLDLFIMPRNEKVEIGSYLEISVDEWKRAYRVVGYDFISTDGVIYVSIEPTILRDMTPAPEQAENDKSSDFFWLGGVNNL